MTINPNARNRGLTPVVGRSTPFFWFLLAIALSLPCLFIMPAQAQNQTYDAYNLTALPERVGDFFILDLFASQLLVSSIFLLMGLIPMTIITRSKKASWIPELGATIAMLGFCVAVGWLNVFFFVVVCFIIALMMAGKARTFITGKG